MTKAQNRQREELLRDLSRLFTADGFSIHKGPYDLLAHCELGGFFVTCAVLDEGRERGQAEMAVARLLGQRYFDLNEDSFPSTFNMIALSEEPPEEIIGFFACATVWTCWKDGERWIMADPVEKNVKQLHPARYRSGERITPIRSLYTQ